MNSRCFDPTIFADCVLYTVAKGDAAMECVYAKYLIFKDNYNRRDVRIFCAARNDSTKYTARNPRASAFAPTGFVPLVPTVITT